VRHLEAWARYPEVWDEIPKVEDHPERWGEQDNRDPARLEAEDHRVRSGEPDKEGLRHPRIPEAALLEA
jgi:hypothetical protein